MRPFAGPAAEPPRPAQAERRHASRRSLPPGLVSRGGRRAALPLALEGRTRLSERTLAGRLMRSATQSTPASTQRFAQVACPTAATLASRPQVSPATFVGGCSATQSNASNFNLSSSCYIRIGGEPLTRCSSPRPHGIGGILHATRRPSRVGLRRYTRQFGR